MADISQVKLPNGDTYNLVDETSGYIKNYTETDPVFSASAAAGITSTDISNWNGKSSTDEKVKATALTFDDSTHYPIFGNSSGNAETKNYTNAFTIGASSTYNHLTLQLGNANTLGRLQLYRGGGDSNRWTVIAANLATGNRTITLPDKTGTVALTSDIPDTSSFLTSETDPVFSASAAAGITSTDISNWNGKSNTDEKVKAIALPTTSSTYYLVLGSNSGTAETKNYSNKLTFEYRSSQVVLRVGDTTSNQKGRIYLHGSSATSVTYLDTAATVSRTITFPDKGGTIALTSDIPSVPTKVSDLTNDSGFISSYTETDPVFSASAAAGITSTDISNWNAKVSDDKTWNGVSLGVSGTYTAADQYIPVKATNALSGTASQIVATQTPVQYRIAKYDDNAYLNSTTPSANDNSTKVATTAYVDAAIPKVYSSTNTGGYLTMATLPIYDGTVE